MQIGALIVAAGMSKRMGEFKPMLSIGSISVAQRVVATLSQAGVSKIVMVTGYNATLLETSDCIPYIYVGSYHLAIFYNKMVQKTNILTSPVTNQGFASTKAERDTASQNQFLYDHYP